MTENNNTPTAIEMTFAEWYAKYQPITAVISEEYGYTRDVFESIENAIYFTGVTDENCFWSLGNDNANAPDWIIPGVWSMNIYGYYVTKIPCEWGLTVYVKMDHAHDYS